MLLFPEQHIVDTVVVTMLKPHYFMLLILFLGCSHSGEPSKDDIVHYTGTIVQKSADLYLIQSDIACGNGITLFYPTNLGNEFKGDSLRVRFSGSFENDPPSPFPYPPLHLSEITVINN